MVITKCEQCKDFTHHLIIFKNNIEYWECQECGKSDITVLTTVNEATRKEIVGRYYEVSGAMLHQDSMLVESIRPVCICSQEALADALKEAGAGGTL